METPLPEPSLAAVFANIAADAFYLVDAEGHVSFMNPAAEKMFGWSSQELRGRVLHDTVHYKHRDGTPFPMSTCPLVSVMSSGQAVTDHADWFIHKDGHFVPVLCSSAPLLRNGQIEGAALVIHGLSARASAEVEKTLLASRVVRVEAERAEALRRVEEARQSAEESRGAEAEERKRAEFEQQLIGIVSHDLRNPLQVIRLSATQGLKAVGLDARQSRAFERILSSSDRALRMINDLLDFTRVRLGGGIGVERDKAVDLHSLVAQVVDEVLVTRPERHVVVERSGNGWGFWDADRLSQVVHNLVGNALQHTTEDVPVRVRTRGEEEDVVLEVHNGGTPIPSEDLPRLFEPFQRGRSTRPDGGRSMGLGLYITYHLVREHGGQINVRSSASEGTTFTVRLPRDG